MGLDNFASQVPDDLVLSEEDEKAFEEAGIELCGGIISGGGSSFRGKVYDTLIEKVTNISLYSKWLCPETVKLISQRLSKYTPEELFTIRKNMHLLRGSTGTAKEMANLQKFFQVCAERGLGIIGWW